MNDRATESTLKYLSGFGSHHESEAIAGALPVGRNSPQKAPLGLYAEQLSGTAFTVPRAHNLRSWLYKRRPSATHPRFERADDGPWRTSPCHEAECPPDRMRWAPMPMPARPTDFVAGLATLATAGDARMQHGSSVHVYAANRSMERYLYDADGDLLIVPQEGALSIATEMGTLAVSPGEFALIPRAVKFRVDLADGSARGFVCENHGHPFRLPELGPIGANGLAAARDFLAPTAAFEERDGPCELLARFGGSLWRTQVEGSPLDVVAWHGNYYPYKYDLARFNTINTVSFDHPDPSIFTVLTSPSDTPGMANVDFVVFPPRWMVAEDTFRPPYFHRNVMSEFMGLVHGEYDAKKGGFVPGASSVHNAMTAHGPDRASYEKAVEAKLGPVYQDGGLAFMFEGRFVFEPTSFALHSPLLDTDYQTAWAGFPVAVPGGKKQ